MITQMRFNARLNLKDEGIFSLEALIGSILPWDFGQVRVPTAERTSQLKQLLQPDKQFLGIKGLGQVGICAPTQAL